MTDVVDKATRSRMMAGIRGKNTKPEMIVRKALHARGFRFRLHVKDLPGKPTAAKISQFPSQTITCMPDGNAAWPGLVFSVAPSGLGVCG